MMNLKLSLFLKTQFRFLTFLILGLSAFLLISLDAKAQDTLSVKLNEAVKSYQNKDFESAKNTLESELPNHRNDSVLLYNLGLAEYKLGKVGLAIAYLRKALSVSPNFNDAKIAYDFALSQMSQKPITTQDSSTWSWMYYKVIEMLNFHFIFPVFLILFLISTLKIAQFLGARKRALLNDEVLPSLSTPSITLLFMTVFLCVLSATLLSDLLLEKATIINSKGFVRTGPSDQDTVIYEIPEATQVIIRDTSNGWYKVEDPTGKTGWMNTKEIFITTENI